MPIGRSRVTYNVDPNTQLPHTASIDILRSLIYLCCERASRGVRIVGVWMASVGSSLEVIITRGSIFVGRRPGTFYHVMRAATYIE